MLHLPPFVPSLVFTILPTCHQLVLGILPKSLRLCLCCQLEESSAMHARRCGMRPVEVFQSAKFDGVLLNFMWEELNIIFMLPFGDNLWD